MTRSVRSLGHKFISRFKRANSNVATKEDLYYCYQLLLNRKPDKIGYQHWLELIEQTQMERRILVNLFLETEEFQKKRSQLKNERSQVTLPDFKMVVNPNDFAIGSYIFETKIYEPHVSNAIKSQLKSGDTFVDIGANIGYFTLLAASIVGEKGQVYAFEPSPLNRELIKENITLNGFSNVKIFPYAIAESKQTLNYHGGDINSNGQVSNILPEQEGLFTVEAVALDDILLESEKITVIKMDIEGAEARALKGMSQIVSKFQPIIFTEFSPRLLAHVSDTSPQEYLTSLQEHYNLCILDILELKTELQNIKSRSISEIMEAHSHSGKMHLDLMAYPRKSTN